MECGMYSWEDGGSADQRRSLALTVRPLREMELFFSNWRLRSVQWEEAVHIDFSATIIARSLICGPLLCTPTVVVWAGGVGRSGEVFAREGGIATLTWDPFS